MAISMGSVVAYLELDTSNFAKGFQSALSDLKVFKSDSATAEQKLKGLSGAMSTVGSGLSKYVTVPLAGIGGAAAKVSMDFESAMSQVKAISGATGEDFVSLRNKAIEMGNKTSFSATESAEAFKYMAMAGWSTESMLDGIEGVMNLAAASGEDLATTSDIVTDALTAFGYTAKDTQMFVDVLATAATTTNTDVYKMGETFKYIAPVAGSMGVSVQDAAESIGLMANAGIKGSQAGTTLRSIMNRIATDAGASSKKLGALGTITKELGVEVFDSSGNMRDWSDIIDECRDAWSGLSQQQQANYGKTIAGQEALSGWLAIMNAAPEDIQNVKDALSDVDGAAQEMSDIMLDNTAGAITILSSALETAAITIGDRLAPHIREMAETITDLTNKFNSLSDEQIDMIVTIGKVVAAVGPALLIGSKVVSTISGVIKAYTTLKKALTGTEAFKSAVDAIKLIRAGYGGLVFQMTGIPSVIAKVTAAFSAVSTFITGTMIPAVVSFVTTFGLPIAVIAAVIGALVLLYNKCEWFRDGVDSVVEAVIGFFQQLPDFFASLPDVIGEWFDNTVESVSQWGTDTWNAITDTIGGIGEAVGEFFSGIPETISEWLSTAINTVITWGGNLLQTMSEAVGNAISTAVQFFSDLPYNIGYALGYALGTIIRWGIDLFNWAVETIPQVIDSIVTFFTELPGKIWEWLVNTYQNVTQWGSDMINKAIEVGTEFLNNVITFFTELPSKIWEFLTTAYENVTQWVSDMIDKSIETGREFLNNIVTFFTELPSKVQSFISNAYKNVVTWASEMKQKAIETGKQFLDNIVKFFTELPGKVLKFLNDVIKNVTTFASDMAKKATEAATKFKDNIIEGLQKIPDKVLGIGQDIVEGLWSGISGAAGWIKDKIGDFAQGILDGMKDALGVHSPSVKAEKIASYLPPGVANGIRKNKKVAIDAMKEMSEDVLNAAEDMTDIEADVNIKSGVENVSTVYSDLFRTISDDFRDAFIPFAETLREIFGEMFTNTSDVMQSLNNTGVTLGMREIEHGSTVSEQGVNNTNNTGGDTYNFYSTVPSPYEYARQIKKTKREILEGFA
uniref:Minor tail protein n=1 Tax=Dulem virus 36 TaxID=3145754 RepID=A0AAU8B252_9CAUD